MKSFFVVFNRVHFIVENITFIDIYRNFSVTKISVMTELFNELYATALSE